MKNKVEIHEYIRGAYRQFGDKTFRIKQLNLSDKTRKFIFIKNAYFDLVSDKFKGSYVINEQGLALFNKDGKLKATSKKLISDNFNLKLSEYKGKRHELKLDVIPEDIMLALSLIKNEKKFTKLKFETRDAYRRVLSVAAQRYTMIRPHLFHYVDYCLTNKIKVF